ncbi:uncharacterized protein LOC114350138 [Ostrinia furnacalis]|uniref:uncharacterized protein LOC114350138 n=1 Tax=Ostrinia furnacalis TaxID=93504 RepID=UPI00103A1B1F|nr:uncharacterized protein LOC114350138 [Ostrinia furnacalis]
MSKKGSRISYGAFRDVEFQSYLRQVQPEYAFWWSRERVFSWLRSLPEDTLWNCLICVVALLAIIWVIVGDVKTAAPRDEVDVFIRNLYERQYTEVARRRTLFEVQLEQAQGNLTDDSTYTAGQFLVAIYMVNKMFIPIGPSVAPSNDIERIACLLVMITGCLVVTGAAVASLSLVISIYMRPEEAFRARYRLIMKEMKESHVLPSLREKVETFYKMYWHKQKAVSATQLLPTYPPTLPATVNTEIYFEATQKSRILCDLSYQFLSEVAKTMNTIHYIPGDTIIKRTTRKSSIIYITYGDIEMLSAEDDSTAVVRMTRGTAVAGCGGSAAAACARAHVEIRAATFCTAHALHAPDLWRVANNYGHDTHQTQIILASFNEHLERVKKHYSLKIPEDVKYKSSILHFKKNLMALKEATDSDGKLLLDRRDIFLEIAGCYIMRNRADGRQTDEADAICLRSTFPCILQPWSSLQIAWHSFMCCVILTVCFTHPYFLIFKKTVPLEFRFFDYVVTALYLVDLIVHLSTGANVEEGVPITFAQTSSQQMRSHWFVIDVVGTLPIFECIQSADHFAGINKLLRLPKVFRVLKSMEEMCVYNSNVLRFMSYTLLLVIACYLIASIQQGFMCFRFNYCLVGNFTHPPYWKNSTLDEETVVHRLIFGLYWAISMITFTTHMEPFGVENWHSVLYTMVVLEICIVLHIFIEAVYSATIMVTTALREDYDSCIANVKDFLIRNEVDEQLRQRFITYLQLCWYTDKAYSMTNRKTSIFYDLPPHVYQNIVTRQRSKYLLSIPFMKLLNKEELKNVSSKAKLFYTTPNEILLNTGDISNEIYLIKQGICEIVDPDTKEVVGSLGVKSHFGVLECLLRVPAYYTVRAVTHVQVFTISTKVLSKAMSLPKIKDAVEFAKEQPEFGRLAVRRESFLRYEAPEKAPNMMRFRLPRKYEEDFAFLHPFNRLGYFSILRYIFPRFTIRPDGDYLLRYEWCRAFCALLSAIVFPSYSYLVLQWPGLYYFSWLLDLSAYFDILQRMLVGYFNEQGVLVYHPTSTAAHYVKGAFFADMMACMPLEFLESPHRESFENNYRLTQSRQLLMLNRLLQLYRLPSAMIALENKIGRRDLLLVLKAIPLFLALLNALTCFMVFNSVNIFHSENSDSWLIVPLADQGGRFNMTETPFNLHLATHFWVVYETTTTGYNSFNPSNFQLMEILFVGMVIGAMITTYFSVRIISIRANVNKELAAYQEHIKDILVFMRREKLNKKLQKEVISYYEYNWDKMGGVDYTNVLKLCDQITLRTDAILHIYGPVFARCPLLSDCDVSLLRMVGRAVRSLYFLRDMRLVEENDVIGCIYFVDYGSVDVRMSSETDPSADSTVIAKLTRGSVFGNLENATTVRCPVSIVASSRTHVLQINAAAFHRIIADFPQVADTMQQYRQQNENYIIAAEESQKRKPSLAAILFTSREGISQVYFDDEYVQLYLIIVSLSCIYADLYNAGFQNNSMPLIIVLYALDVGFYLKILMQYSLPHIMPERMKSTFLPLRRVTVYNCLKKHHSHITVNLTLSTVFSVLVWFTLFVHTAACLWHFISLIEDNAKANSSWIYNDSGGSLCHNLYVCSVYFVLTTFTQNGVGDIMPKNHAETEFKYDLTSCLPFELISFGCGRYQWMVFSYLRLNRLFRIVTVYNCLKKHHSHITVNLTLSTVFSVLVWFTLFVHTAACLWHFISLIEDNAKANSSWIYNDSGGSLCHNLYVCSVYFVLTTFTQNGVGDIMPKNHAEIT